jgi:THO complex subunit 2
VFFKNVYEAGRLGTFLDATLLTVRLWKDDVDGAFVRDCENSVGFAMRPSEGDAGKKATREDFYKLAHKWHVRVGKAFINCLEESEYMTVRNSLAVLTRVTSEFPATKRVGAHILRAAEKIQKTDTRRDLKTVAARYLAMLTKAKVNWVSEHGFNPHHPMDAKELEQKAAQERKKQAAERAARDAETKEKARAAPKRDGGGGRGGGARGAADAGVDKAKADAKEKGAALSAGAREFTPTKAPGAAPRSARDRDRNVRAAAAASDGGGGGAKRRRDDDSGGADPSPVANPSKRFRSDDLTASGPSGGPKGGGRGGGRGDARGGGRGDSRGGGARDRDDRGGRGGNPRGDRDRNARGGDRGRDAPRATRVVRR